MGCKKVQGDNSHCRRGIGTNDLIKNLFHQKKCSEIIASRKMRDERWGMRDGPVLLRNFLILRYDEIIGMCLRICLKAGAKTISRLREYCKIGDVKQLRLRNKTKIRRGAPCGYPSVTSATANRHLSSNIHHQTSNIQPSTNNQAGQPQGIATTVFSSPNSQPPTPNPSNIQHPILHPPSLIPHLPRSGYFILKLHSRSDTEKLPLLPENPGQLRRWPA